MAHWRCDCTFYTPNTDITGFNERKVTAVTWPGIESQSICQMITLQVKNHGETQFSLTMKTAPLCRIVNCVPFYVGSVTMAPYIQCKSKITWMAFIMVVVDATNRYFNSIHANAFWYWKCRQSIHSLQFTYTHTDRDAIINLISVNVVQCDICFHFHHIFIRL